jgi:flagellar basal-body rod protein FlgF
VLGQLALMATPSGTLTPLSGTLYTPPAGAALNPSADGSVHQGYLNDSNVDPTLAMVEMIDDSRSYQLQTDLIKTQSTNQDGMNAVLANA